MYTNASAYIVGNVNCCDRIATIKSGISLAEHIQARGIPLRKESALLKANCPFHADSNASFKVYPDAHFHCYGCGKHGDVIDFEQYFTGCNRRDAMDRLDGGQAAPVTPSRPKPAGNGPDWLHDLLKYRERPKRQKPANEDLAQLEELRSISAEALQVAADRGLLHITKKQGHRAWLIADQTGELYIMRRLDGKAWNQGQKSLYGAGGRTNWPIGILESEHYPAIALCEGGPDFLAAFGHAWASSVEHLVAPVCMGAAGSVIAKDALKYFKGKRVRTFIHDDEAGDQAYERWKAQLEDIASKVDGYEFSGLVKTNGEPVTDLNDLLLIDANSWTDNQQVVESIMDFANEGNFATEGRN
jgi:hypothetical protein